MKISELGFRLKLGWLLWPWDIVLGLWRYARWLRKTGEISIG